jgi:hypothetical protein
MPLKMFCVKGFADGMSADHYFGSAAVVIGAINTAATDVVKNLAGNNGVQQTFVIERLWKQNLISGTARKPIANDWLQFPLWIKVPPMPLLLAGSFRRHIIRRLPLKRATNKHAKPERFMIPARRTALFAAGQAGLWILFMCGGDFHD